MAHTCQTFGTSLQDLVAHAVLHRRAVCSEWLPRSGGDCTCSALSCWVKQGMMTVVPMPTAQHAATELYQCQ